MLSHALDLWGKLYEHKAGKSRNPGGVSRTLGAQGVPEGFRNISWVELQMHLWGRALKLNVRCIGGIFLFWLLLINDILFCKVILQQF